MTTATKPKPASGKKMPPPAGPPPATIPMEAMVAISTERTLFLSMLETKLNAGELLPLDQQLGMVGLLKEFVAERTETRGKLQRLQELVSNLIGQGKGYMTKLHQLDAALRGTDLVPGEEIDE